MFYTYLHRRASDLRPFYVGKGKGLRAYGCLGRNPFWNRTVQKHGFIVEIIAHWPQEADAFEHEKFLITCFRAMGHSLANMTDGGEGGSGISPSPETRSKLSAKNRGRKMPPSFGARLSLALKGMPKSSEHRLKLSQANLGKTRSQDALDSFSRTMRGRPQSSEHILKRAEALRGKLMSVSARAAMSQSRKRGGANVNAKSVICVETDQRFASLSEACAWLLTQGHGKPKSHRITDVLAGRKKTAFGYSWKLHSG